MNSDNPFEHESEHYSVQGHLHNQSFIALVCELPDETNSEQNQGND